MEKTQSTINRWNAEGFRITGFIGQALSDRRADLGPVVNHARIATDDPGGHVDQALRFVEGVDDSMARLEKTAT